MKKIEEERMGRSEGRVHILRVLAQGLTYILQVLMSCLGILCRHTMRWDRILEGLLLVCVTVRTWERLGVNTS